MDTENRLMVVRGEEPGGGAGGKMKGLRSTNWQLQNSHEDVKYKIWNIVKSV